MKRPSLIKGTGLLGVRGGRLPMADGRLKRSKNCNVGSTEGAYSRRSFRVAAPRWSVV